MYRKNYFTFLLAAAIFLTGSIAANAQTSPVRGEVKLKKADGTLVPVADAVVEAYRTDIAKGMMPAAKTNKKGEFSFIGFPLGQRFALTASAPGVGPRVQVDVRAGQENIVLIVEEGDGRKLTEAEVREVAGAAASIPAGGLSAAQKKEQAELVRKNAEITAKNEKLKMGDEVARKANTEGVEAIKAKNYDLAITKFSEGVAAVPDYVGSTPVMLNGKMVALKARAYDSYKEGAGSTDAALRKAKYESANKDFDEGLAAYEQAMAVIKGAPAAASPEEQKSRTAVAVEVLSNAMEIHRLKAVSGIDSAKTAQAVTIVEEYIAAEPDAVKKTKAKATLGDIMRAAGEFDKAIAAYKSVLEVTPDNHEVMASLGLSLVALGTSVEPANKEQMQEGLNFMQKFADTAPDTHPLKASVKETVEYLKTEQNLKPQTPAKAGARKKN